MATRLFAAAFLLASILVAWVTITIPFAARTLQLAIGVSMAYVAWLAWRGSRVMRRSLLDARSGASEPTGLANDLPFVSLIVPARNEQEVIDDTVRSLSAIRYHREGTPAFEVLVVDDGSDDATGEAARSAVQDGASVSVRRREPGSGRATKGAVLAFAMPYVSGDVIGIIDADTRVDPSFLERVMRAWTRDPRADALQVARRPRNADHSWLTAGAGRGAAHGHGQPMRSLGDRWHRGAARQRDVRAARGTRGGGRMERAVLDRGPGAVDTPVGLWATRDPGARGRGGGGGGRDAGCAVASAAALGGGQSAASPRAWSRSAGRVAAAQSQGRFPGVHRRIPHSAAVRGHHRGLPRHHPDAPTSRLDGPGDPVHRLRLRGVPAGPGWPRGRGTAWAAAGWRCNAWRPLPEPLAGGGAGGAGPHRASGPSPPVSSRRVARLAARTHELAPGGDRHSRTDRARQPTPRASRRRRPSPLPMAA